MSRSRGWRRRSLRGQPPKSGEGEEGVENPAEGRRPSPPECPTGGAARLGREGDRGALAASLKVPEPLIEVVLWEEVRGGGSS